MYTPQSRHTPQADTPLGRHPAWQTPPSPWRDTPTPTGQTPPTPTGPTALGRHPTRQNLPVDGHCSGRYASYWNAFLSVMVSGPFFHHHMASEIFCYFFRPVFPSLHADGNDKQERVHRHEDAQHRARTPVPRRREGGTLRQPRRTQGLH